MSIILELVNSFGLLNRFMSFLLGNCRFSNMMLGGWSISCLCVLVRLLVVDMVKFWFMINFLSVVVEFMLSLMIRVWVMYLLVGKGKLWVWYYYVCVSFVFCLYIWCLCWLLKKCLVNVVVSFLGWCGKVWEFCG